MSRLGGAIRFIAVVSINSKVAAFFFGIYETFRDRSSLRLHESNLHRHAVALIGGEQSRSCLPVLYHGAPKKRKCRHTSGQEYLDVRERQVRRFMVEPVAWSLCPVECDHESTEA
jgi:hypothetical protein